MSTGWEIVFLAVSIYCIVQAVRDFRRRDYALALAGAVCAALLLLLPIKTQAVKLDLPASSP